MRKIKETTEKLLLESLIGDTGKVPWYLINLYMYRTGKPLYTVENCSGDFTKVFYNSADSNIVAEVYVGDRMINRMTTLDYYTGRGDYYVDLNLALERR